MPSGPIELPHGTLGPAYPSHLGIGAAARLGRFGTNSADLKRPAEGAAGSLYTALHRLERRGWIRARWGTSDHNRRSKFYELTKAGRRQLEIEQDAWEELTAVVSQILRTA